MSRTEQFFRDKAVLITGASSGIGEELAWQLSQAGAKLTLAARRTELLEALVQKIAQESAVLRNAFAVNARRGRHCVGCVLGVGREIANRGETSASHHRVGHDVDVFVDFAGLEATV